MILAFKQPKRGVRRRTRAFCQALVVAAVWVQAAPLHAEEAELRSAARDLAAQGAEAFEAGRFEQASDFFRRAFELVQAPSIALMRARSLAKLGHLLQAVDIYEQTARLKLAADAPDAYQRAVETARTEVDDARNRLAHLKLNLVGANAHEPLTVTIDDKPTPTALLGVEQPIDPGVHVLLARSGTNVRASKELTLSEGQRSEVDLPVASAPAASPPPTVAEVPKEQQKTPHELGAHPPLLAYAALGVSGIGLAVGTYAGLVALHHKSNLDAACHPGCPPSARDDLDGFRSNRTVSWISYGVGIAAGAAGVLLLTVGKPEREHVAIRMLPNGLQLAGRL